MPDMIDLWRIKRPGARPAPAREAGRERLGRSPAPVTPPALALASFEAGLAAAAAAAGWRGESCACGAPGRAGPRGDPAESSKKNQWTRRGQGTRMHARSETKQACNPRQTQWTQDLKTVLSLPMTHDIASHRIASHRIASYRILSHRIAVAFAGVVGARDLVRTCGAVCASSG